MKAICRSKDGKNSPFLANIDIPHATPNHVIVKVMAAPINPSDEGLCRGGFGTTDYEPYVCGFEGAGVITEVGDGVPKDVIGKKVTMWPAFGTPVDKVGMWCQYARAPYDSCVFLKDTDNCEDYCELFVNPLTLLGFVRVAKEMKQKAFINTAAMSALGKSLAKICAAEGIALIGIVRKDDDVKSLLSLGAKHALNLNDPKFEENLKELVTKYDCHLAFDAVLADLTPRIIKCLPSNSMVYSYGKLGGSDPQLESVKELMKKNNIKNEWFMVMKDKIFTVPEEKKKAKDFIQKDVNEGGKFFKVVISKKLKLEQFKEALETYKKVATSGKVLFLPNA